MIYIHTQTEREGGERVKERHRERERERERESISHINTHKLSPTDTLMFIYTRAELS